jgi:branched-chain amino acid transport system permease protein
VYALSAVGIVVLYRATAVLNFAAGAIGAVSAFVAWELVNEVGMPRGFAFVIAILVAGFVTVGYGMFVGPRLAQRDPLQKAMATLGLLLILLGAMSWYWGTESRVLALPTTEWTFEVFGVIANVTEVLAVVLGVGVTGLTTVFLRVTKLGTAMRAMADDREITASLGVPVRRVEAAAWFGSGVLFGITGLVLAVIVGLDQVTLTFLIIASLAAALVGRLSSLWTTVAAAIAIGVIQSCLTSVASVSEYRTATPFVVAIIAVLVLSYVRPAQVRV